MEATGTLFVGEGVGALAFRKARQGLSPRQIKLILAISMLAVGIPISAWISGSWIAAVVSVEFAIVGLIVGAYIVQWLAPIAQRRALAERGQGHEISATLRLDAEGLVYELGGTTVTASWPGITDLYSTRKYWVFLSRSAAIVLPRRFFQNRETEREFISEALSQMLNEARARSPDATRFVSA